MKSARIIVIIGLPCSGKSSLSNTFTNYLILDDYFCKYYTAELSRLIVNHPKIVINDPRLCYQTFFNSIVDELKKKLTDEEILYIFFENDSYQCLLNEKDRDDKKYGIEEEIKRMSKVYNVEELIKQIGNESKYEIHKVYCSNNSVNH